MNPQAEIEAARSRLSRGLILLAAGVFIVWIMAGKEGRRR